MKISIAMATYNGEKFIRQQLESFSRQTVRPDEVVISDDCSFDNTIDIIEDFARSSSFKIKLIKNSKNLGYTQNFNNALLNTTSDLVFLSDQDDVWFSNKIELMLSVAKNNANILLFMNDAALTDRNLNCLGLTKIGQIKSSGLSLDRFVMGCCCLIRRELLEICLPIPEGFAGHDNWIVKFAGALNSKLIVNSVLQYYRRHDKNYSKSITNNTKKIGRLGAAFGMFWVLVKTNNKRHIEDSINKNSMFIDRIVCAKEKAPRKYVTYLSEMEFLLLKKINADRQRLNIVGEKLSVRVFNIIKLIKNGVYNNTDGYKSVLRDIINN